MIPNEASLEEIASLLDYMDLSQLKDLYYSLSEFREQPVDINEFIDSDRYLGPYFGNGFIPYWRGVLNDIYPTPYYSPYYLVSLKGAIGRGKTTTACTGICYDAYRLICMSNPQKAYGLVQSTSILFAIFNVTMSLSTDVIWDKLSQMFMASPFFSKLLGPLGTKKNKKDTLFPNRIDFFLGSRMGHGLGKSVYSAIMDEANFEIMGGQIYDNFNSVLRRMESRFKSPDGTLPGKLWLVSSESDKSSVVNNIVESYKGKPGIYIDSGPIWEVITHKNGRPMYSGETFWVFKGSEVRQPEVIHDEDTLLKELPDLCIKVPMEFHDSFTTDINAALRDLAGVSTASSYKLFRMRDRVYNAMTVTPLFPETIKLDFDNPDDQLSEYLIFKGYFSNPLLKNIPRYIHVDIGISGDRLGISAAYVSGFTQRVSRDMSTFQEVKESLPDITVEWALGIEPTPGKQVPLYKIRTFIKWLSQQGYLIGGITFDGYQSTDSIQQLNMMGYDCKLLSMDRDVTPYLILRSSVYEGRCALPKHKIAGREFEELELSPDGSKVDHPDKNRDGTRGSKDIVDSIGGSVYGAYSNSHKTRLVHHEIATAPLSKTVMSESLKDLFWGN